MLHQHRVIKNQFPIHESAADESLAMAIQFKDIRYIDHRSIKEHLLNETEVAPI